MDCDLLIKGGTIVDGTGKPAFKGSLAIRDGKIIAFFLNAEETDKAAASCRELLDVTGLTVSPGFIDMHSHADWIMPDAEHPSILAPLLEQGITTVIGGNCGYSPAPLAPNSPYLDFVGLCSDFLMEKPLRLEWDTMRSFLDYLESKGVALNLAMLAGHGNLRLSMFGNNHAYPGEKALSEMESIAAAALEEGAVGISLGLGYVPGIFSEIRELERFAVCAQKYNRLLTVHLKAYTRLSGAYPLKLFGNKPHNLRALEEIIALAERTNVKIQLSHLLFVGEKTWPSVDQFIGMIDSAVLNGQDIAFDSFPYTCGNTTIYVVYPAWFLNNIEQNFKSVWARRRLKWEIALLSSQLGFGLEDIQVLWGGHPEADRYNGMFFAEIASQMGCSVFEAYLKISALGKGKTLCLLHKYNGDAKDESVYHKIFRHPLNLVESDTILTRRGIQNPASFGAFPRAIQRYHKEMGLLTLEETVARMTGKSAQRFGIKDRGIIGVGYWADLTIFDYCEIKDNTTLHNLEVRPSGIKNVFINGMEVVREGKVIAGRLAGKVLRAT
ncbi:MAG TPA: amidohydrolase family protein [Candidatus Limnocylindrales bacterium]|nr:amidohydrolase family protein [Candidatus Limnocylindrales bacterium]